MLSIKNYLRDGMSVNFAQVAVSLVIGFFTTLTVFDSLSRPDFLIFSTIQLTIFLFVNFSSLEYKQIIRTKIPISEKTEGYELTRKLVKTCLYFLIFVSFIYILFSEIFNFYVEFGQKRYLFYIFVILCSIPQLCFNFVASHISATFRFKELEIGYIKYIHPLRILTLLLFYFYFPNLMFILFTNLIVRIAYLILSLKLIGKEFLIKKSYKERQSILNFSFFNDLKFSLSNFVYENFPLLFFSFAPIIINRYFNSNDAAVFALSLSIFNAIKPLLNGLTTLVNPMIIDFTQKRNEVPLYGIVHFFIKLISVTSVFGMSIFWILFNFTIFTDIVFAKFSYLLFLDYLISVIFISIFYTLTMFQRSYFLAKGKQSNFFIKSIFSLILSSSSIFLYIQFELGVNLVFVGIVVFYMSFYALLSIGSSKLFINAYIFVYILISPIFLITNRFESLNQFILLLVASSLITVVFIRKIIKQDRQKLLERIN